MKNVQTLFLVLFLLCGSLVFSQTHKTEEATGLPNDLDGKYTPDKASLFNSSTDASSSSKGDGTSIKNVISFDITNLARSTASFYYERALNKIIAAQVGMGAMFNKDEIQQTFIPVGLAIFNSNQNNYGSNSISLTDVLKNSSYNSSGIFLAGGLKLYVSGTAPKGVYFQVGVTYAVSNLLFNSSTYNSYYSYPVSGPPNIAVKNLNFNFTWGYQFVVGVGKVKFVNTVYAGIGIKKISYNGISETTTTNSNGNTVYSYMVDANPSTVVVPSMIIGFSLGVGW